MLQKVPLASGSLPTSRHIWAALLRSELLARQQAPDPVALLRQAGLPPDPWQVQCLRSGASRVLLLCCRQSGKSTVSACLALHTALTQPGSLTLLLSPSLRQSQELFQKVLQLARQVQPPVAPAQASALRLELPTGSRIIALPGTEATIRGYAGVALLVVDEAARVDDALYYSVRPMLAVSGGRLIALSTPYGQRGWFHQAYTSAEAWERITIPATACPRIPSAFLDEERRALPPLWFASEYECAFVDTVDMVFRTAEVLAAVTPAVQPLFAEYGGPHG